MREQEVYWHRFYAFATLQAGAFLLTTSSVIGKSKTLALGALFLAVVWTWVQGLSLGYANRLKGRFHEFRTWLEIPYDYEEPREVKGRAARFWRAVTARLRQPPAPSSTDIGVGVTLLVGAFWVYYFFNLVHVPGAVQPAPSAQPATGQAAPWLSSAWSYALSGLVGALASLGVA